MWEDQQASNEARDESAFRTYRCPRLRKRYESAYRRFRVEPPDDGIDDPNVAYDDQADDDYTAGAADQVFPRADEIDAEPASGFERESDPSARPIGEEQGVDPLAETHEDTDPISEESVWDEAREGLRAIFAIQSDLTARDMGEEPYREPEGSQESMDDAAYIQPDEQQYRAESTEPEPEYDRTTTLEPANERELRVEPARPAQVPQPRNEKLVWKSFPKPLRRK